MSKRTQQRPTKQTESTLDELFATRRWCYTIPEIGGLVPGRGWRVSVAFEGIQGHYPTGDLDFDSPTHVEPWWWGGPDDPYEHAEQICAEQNQALGLDVSEVWQIIASTMGANPRQASPVFHRRARKR